jgi:threonine aldolase
MMFASDNWSGASDKVLAAFTSAMAGFAPAYGNDAPTKRVTERLADLFQKDVHVFLVASGTGANALAIQALTPRWGGAVMCHAEAHVDVDEGGASEFYSGVKMLGIPGVGGKIPPDALLAKLADNKRGRTHPTALSITNLTECGQAYSVHEVSRLGLIAEDHGLKVHMDGARFANAIAASEAAPADLTWRAGVDILTLGGTKNGCLIAEAIIVFDPALAPVVDRLRLRAGHLLSKQRVIAAQFDAWLDDEHWLDLADHANAMGRRLAAGLDASRHGRPAWPTDANEVFAIFNAATVERLKAAGAAFYPWPATSLPATESLAPTEAIYRLVTSFATTPDEVDGFLAVLNGE